MNYRNRHLEGKLRRYADIFPVIVLLGARQVGKSTLLAHVLGPTVSPTVFDPVVDVGNARRDPEFFLDQQGSPAFLDEIQYAPELLPVIKRRVDRQPKPGSYFLTGSQNPAVLGAVSESLAGRAMVLELGGMTLVERSAGAGGTEDCWLEALLSGQLDPHAVARRERCVVRPAEDTLFKQLWRGVMPGFLDLESNDIPDTYASYVRTYVERDVRRLAEVEDQQLFTRFVSLCAALTGQEINHSQLGRELGLSPQTARRWLAILKATYQWMEIPPYHGSTVKRISGRVKGYLRDTGLAGYLQRISSPEALAGHPLQGAIFESFVVNELMGRFPLLRMPPAVYHWRTHAGAEVDLLLERDGCYFPVEIKSAARVTRGDTRGILAFRETYPSLRHGPGLVVAAVEENSVLPGNVFVIPYDLV
ncbi:MAG: ATP-binding protein [Kiritimatiellae bacterium]|nr:ATP-binding protein [Kiritimatiellia bacterium]